MNRKIFVGFSTVDKKIPDVTLYDIELVKRDLLNHFMTKKGERVMNPEFGSNIWNLLFEPFNRSIRSQIFNDVVNIINQEPRVELIDVNIKRNEHSIEIECLLNFVPFNVREGLYIRYIRNNFEYESF